MKSLFVLLCLTLASVLVTAQTTGLSQGEPIVVGTGGLLTSGVYLDASQFTSGTIGTCTLGTNDNICIANAIAAIPGTPSSGGGEAIIDISNLGLNHQAVFLANPFINIISTGFTAAQKCGILRLGNGIEITTQVPIDLPTCWTWEYPEGHGDNGATLIAGSNFPTTYNAGTVTTNAAGGSPLQFNVTGSGTSFLANVTVGEIFAVCQNNGANGLACGGNGTTMCGTACGNQAYGTVLAVNSNTSLLIGTNNAANGSANTIGSFPSGVNYAIYAPLMLMGTMSQTGPDAGNPVKILGGVFQCEGKAGCVNIANYSSQEQTEIRNVNLGTFADSALDIEGNAFNGAYVDSITITSSSPSCVPSTIPIIVRIAANSGKQRSFSHSTLNLDAGGTGGCANVGIDWETPGDLYDWHYENTGNTSGATIVSVGDTLGAVPSVTCPVICVQPVNPGNGAHIHDIDSTTTAGQIGVTLQSGAADVLIESLALNSPTVISDLSRSCTVSGGGTNDGHAGIYWLGRSGSWFGTFTNSTNSCGSGGAFTGAVTGTLGLAGTIDQTSKTAAITTATLCAATANTACGQAGQYHVHFDVWGSGTACTVVGTGGVTPSLTWTDENGTAHSAVVIPMLSQTSATAVAVETTAPTVPFQTAFANQFGSGDFTISTNGTVIQYAVAYAGCTTGTGTYNVRAAVTRLQ
jgi:hypothetical protein